MEVFREDKEVCSKCSHLSYYPLVIAKAEGAIITDVDGNEFIDFLSSASSLNMGSAFPPVVKAMKDQIDSFSQYTPAYTYNMKTTAYAKRPQLRLTARSQSLCPTKLQVQPGL